jgi:hypothetical protein
MTRPIREIAADVRADWANVHGMAEPALAAMETLDSIHDSYYQDSGVEVVARFVDAARTWKGPTARRIKEELRAILDSV